MTAGPPNHFILVYDIAARHVDVHSFGTDRGEATRAYSVLEDEYSATGKYEVVLVGADSLDTVKRTHSPYFSAGTAREVVRDFLASIP